MFDHTDSIFIVVNPAAARTRIKWPSIEKTLGRNEVRFDVYETGKPGDAEAGTRSALNQGYGTIAVVGGDGTLSEATRGFFDLPGTAQGHNDLPKRLKLDSAIALLPTGTGDDFARGLAGHRASLDSWMGKLIAHYRGGQREKTKRQVDVLYASVNNGARKFVCLNAATLGISADVATRVSSQSNTLRRLPGEIRFVLAAAGALSGWHNRTVRITVDGDSSTECATNLLAVVNGAYVGGGMNFVPSARTDDGYLDVIAACGFSRIGVLRELTRIHRGGHLTSPKVFLKSGMHVSVEAINVNDELVVEADGDVRGQTPAEFSIMPGSLHIVW